MKSHRLINTRLSRVIELSHDTESRGGVLPGANHQYTVDPHVRIVYIREPAYVSVLLDVPPCVSMPWHVCELGTALRLHTPK